ncbi:flagellar protein FliL [Halolactibacillus miurensis]|uniref:Flagellar protein FliL n=1 Tax=Halolactibacillus miurensis TaxID=306541 RepID=A0A1I6QEM8_9BACI|nr:flagellar basal body-associated FliL family protein [Halolactibacillus miurensis]GEM03427.1 flagellar protein FliL [Halolactibacillus miurensis]SFS50738.1 flagellar FliL protein [Halolactibacillus miurensis]
MASKVFKNIIIGLVLVSILGMAAIIYILMNQDDPNRELTIDEQIQYSYTTESINIDLADNRYAQLQFNIITNNEDAKEEVEKRMFQFKNILIKQTVDLESSALQSDLSGFENRLKDEVNVLMEEGEVTDIYLINKIVQ